MKSAPKKVYRLWYIVYSFLIIFSLYTIYHIPYTIYAQTFDIASTYNVADTEVKSGDILIAHPQKGLVRTDLPYDSKIFGAYQEAPLLVYKEQGEATSSGKPIIRSGDVIVNVSNFNGNIGVGDFITTSPFLGLGMKATQSGHVIGVAISTVTPVQEFEHQGRKYQQGLVKVAINIQYAEIDRPKSALRWLEYINAALFKNIQDPEKFLNTLRYFIAGLVGLTAILVGFFGFSRSLAKGVEAIGRNPLAARSIQFSIALNLGLTIVTTLIGLILAIVILRL